MPFTAGDNLCCASDACVLLDTNAASGAETWDLIPHVTLIGATETSNDPKLVTSSSNGAEMSACGTVSRVGNLALACHDGVGPEFLCINSLQRIRWAQDCDDIWLDGAIVAAPNTAKYFEAVIRITSVPVIFDIAGNQPVVTNYGFTIQRWINGPSGANCQTEQIA